jgi:hypothetical protein
VTAPFCSLGKKLNVQSGCGKLVVKDGVAQ